MAVQTRACNNNRQIKAKQAAEASGNPSRRNLQRRRNKGKTIPSEFLESARATQSLQNSSASEFSTDGVSATKAKAVVDNNNVGDDHVLTNAAQPPTTKTTTSAFVLTTTQEIKCKKSGKMFQYPGNFTNSTCTTSTLTPTTLRNIGDAFDFSAEVPPPMEHTLAAGFAPPSVIITQQFNSNQRLQDDVEVKREIIEEDAGYVPTPWATNPGNQQNLDLNIYSTPLPYTSASDVRPQLSATLSPRKLTQTSSPPQRDAANKRRIKDEELPPEEEERRRQRRERNKLAAARCRQRRVDQTNELQNEVDRLVDIQKDLREEYEELDKQKKRLRLTLDQHDCIQNGVSRTSSVPVTSQSSMQHPMSSIVSGVPVVPVSQTVVSSPSQVNVIVRRDSRDSRLAEIVPNTLAAMPQQTEKRPRPSTLPMSMFEQTGVPIQTPSAMLYSFEGLVEGTGMTPTITPIAFSPTSAIQQRHANGDVSTPDTTPRKLVTL